MSKYAKKPEVVEAFQLTQHARAHNDDWPKWMHEAWQLDRESVGSVSPFRPGDGNGPVDVRVERLTTKRCDIGDWIVRGGFNVLSVWNDKEFRATFSEVHELGDGPISARAFMPIGTRTGMHQPANVQSLGSPLYRRYEALNDELHIVRRMLEKPTACMAAPEIMDLMRIAVARVHSQYETLTVEHRRQSETIAQSAAPLRPIRDRANRCETPLQESDPLGQIDGIDHVPERASQNLA